MLQQSILFITGRRNAGDEKLASLRRAILDRLTIRFAYHARRRSDGSTPLMTRDVDPLSWLLGWGRQVRVLEPESLRRRLADEARALFQAHNGECL